MDKRYLEQEGLYVNYRLAELTDIPIQGNFDLKHLQDINAYLFQDLPNILPNGPYKPGVLREKVKDGYDWIKERPLEFYNKF